MIRPEAARAYGVIQKGFARTAAADAHAGPHDSEKKKRLQQLREVKPLDEYYPRLAFPAGAELQSLPDFHSKYEAIQETRPDIVSVIGMGKPLTVGDHGADGVRKGSISATTWLQADVPRHSERHS